VSDDSTQRVIPQTSYVENTASMSEDESEFSDCDEPELSMDLEELSHPNAQSDLRLVESVDEHGRRHLVGRTLRQRFQ
jgi:hypothetical protein